MARSNEEVIRAYIKHKNVKDSAVELQLTPAQVGYRLRYLRKHGVTIPKYGYSSLTPEDITNLSALAASLQ